LLLVVVTGRYDSNFGNVEPVLCMGLFSIFLFGGEHRVGLAKP
jgi:hypothetical protein